MTSTLAYVHTPSRLCLLSWSNTLQRGGGGNVHKEKYGGHTKNPNRLSFIDKAKAFFNKKKEEKKEAKAETTTPAATT